jgi:hypothetical protein
MEMLKRQSKKKDDDGGASLCRIYREWQSFGWCGN